MGILATNLEVWDWCTLAGYFALLMGITWWVILKGKDTAEDYFLAGRNLPWYVIGASIFASNIGSEHVVGLAGSGAKDGVAMAHYELHAWCLLILAWVFVPFYMRSRVFTMPEFLERRFSVASRYVLSIVSLVTFVITKIAVGIYAGGIVFGALLPEMHLDIGSIHLDPFWIGTLLVIILTGLYTILGGMRAVAYNDTIQVIVLVTGSTCLTLYGLSALGDHTTFAAGWANLREACGSDMFNLWKPLTRDGSPFVWAPVEQFDASGKVIQQAWYFNGHFPWLGMLFCAPVIGLWYWCTDQYIVQRALGAPNETIARRGSIFAGMLKILPVFLFIVPGMVCFALAKTNKVPGLENIYDSATGKATAASQMAYPSMVVHLLPTGLRGVVVAGMLSALMGSLAGVFNACSTLFTVDLYSKWKPMAPQHQVVRTGRIATTILVIISICWIPIVKNSPSLYEYLQSVQGYLAPPIFIAFFFGVFFKRLNARGCFWAIVVGSVIGLIRMFIDTPVTFTSAKPLAEQFHYTEGSFLWIINKIQFQYFSILITIISGIVMVVVSYMSEPPDYEKIDGLAYGTRTQKATYGRTWSAIDLVGTAIVLAAITGAYLYFRG
jgi:solute:Na+ symporter, SSS family